jgi:glutathione S-transferase
MTEFVVHSVPGSPFGRAVLLTLEEKGARYRLAAVAPGTLRSPEHLARHPFDRVPALTPSDPRAAARPRAGEAQDPAAILANGGR